MIDALDDEGVLRNVLMLGNSVVSVGGQRVSVQDDG